MDHGPAATLLLLPTPTTPATCPLPGIGLPSPGRSVPRRCLMATLVPCTLITPLSPLLQLKRKWRMTKNPTLNCPLVSLHRRRIFSIVADVPQPSAYLLGPALRQFPRMIH